MDRRTLLCYGLPFFLVIASIYKPTVFKHADTPIVKVIVICWIGYLLFMRYYKYALIAFVTYAFITFNYSVSMFKHITHVKENFDQYEESTIDEDVRATYTDSKGVSRYVKSGWTVWN